MIELELKHHVINAIFSIRPNSEFTVGDTYESLNWLSKDQVKPTETEFDEALKTVKAEYDAQEYARARQAEYPSIEDQQDMQFHDAIDGTTTWQDAIQAVKTKYPKPE